MTTVLHNPLYPAADTTTADTTDSAAEPITEEITLQEPIHETRATVPEAPELGPSGFNENGLRPLTGQDWLVSAGWGIAGALAATAVSVPFLPVHLLALTFILGTGLGVLSYLDYCTQLIRNRHTLVFAAASALLLVALQVITPGAAILVPAVIAAAVTFVFMLALTVFTGLAGGGDIKLSPVPAALLAAVSPIAALLWLLFTFVLCLVGMIAARLARTRRRHMAMAPFMGVAALIAIGVYGVLSQALGI